MQNRLFIFSALLGTLFFVLPVAVQAQFYEVNIRGDGTIGDYRISNTVTAGALLNGNNSYVSDNKTLTLVNDNPEHNLGLYNIYNITMEDITNGSIPGQPAAAVVGADITGVYMLNSLIKFSDSLNHTMQGFIIANHDDTTAFSGTISSGYGITVSNSNNTSTSPYSPNAIGLGFFDNNEEALALNNTCINIGLITVNSNNGDGFGFFSRDITDSHITLGGVNVTAKNFADGVHIESEVTNGNITIGDGSSGNVIEVTGNDSRGLSVNGAFSGNIAVKGNVLVTGKESIPINSNDDGASAIGLQFAGAISGRSISAGDITVTADDDNAIGVDFQGALTNVDTTFGKIDVTANANGNATGISVQGNNSTITLSNDITATSEGSNAFGVVFYSSNNNPTDGTVRVDDNVNIKATGKDDSKDSYALNASGKFTLAFDDGKTLTANRVAAKSLVISGNGKADLAVVHAVEEGTIISNGAVLAVDGAQMAGEEASLGDVSIVGKSRLEIYGNTTDTNTPISGVVVFNGASELQLVNMSSLTKWGVDANDHIIALGTLKTAFANDNYLAASQIHQKYTGLHAVKDHVISGAVVSEPLYDYYGQSNPRYKQRGAWVNYIGRDSHYRSSHNRHDWDFGSNGVQVGSDIFRTRRSQFGAFFGYEGTTGYNIADKLEASDYYAGLYGVHVFNDGTDLRTIFNFGWQDFDTNRLSRGNYYKSSFDGNTVELNVELGKRRYFGNWSARPTLGLDWYYTSLDGVQEKGTGNETFRYNDTDHSQLFFRFGSDMRYEWRRWAIEGGVYYSYDMLGNTLRSGISSLQTGQVSTLVGSKLGRSVLTLNLGGSLTVCPNFSVFGGYRGEVTPERAGDGYAHTGYVGGAWRW